MWHVAHFLNNFSPFSNEALASNADIGSITSSFLFGKTYENITKDPCIIDIVEKLVGKFVKYAIKNKLDGVVCSPYEIKYVRKIAGNKFIIVVPGIRPIDYINKNDDQKRYVTPQEAINLGADFLVIGRPITKSNDPLKLIQQINKSII